MSVKWSDAQANEQENMLSGIRKLTELDMRAYAFHPITWVAEQGDRCGLVEKRCIRVRKVACW